MPEDRLCDTIAERARRDVDLSQIIGPAALYRLRFRSGAWKGTKNGLGFFSECAWTVGGVTFRMIC